MSQEGLVAVGEDEEDGHALSRPTELLAMALISSVGNNRDGDGEVCLGCTISTYLNVGALIVGTLPKGVQNQAASIMIAKLRETLTKNFGELDESITDIHQPH